MSDAQHVSTYTVEQIRACAEEGLASSWDYTLLAEVERLAAERDEALATARHYERAIDDAIEALGEHGSPGSSLAVAIGEIVAERDQTRRAALEEAIAAIDARMVEWDRSASLETDPERAKSRMLTAAAISIGSAAVRALLTQPVRPAPVGASEER